MASISIAKRRGLGACWLCLAALPLLAGCGANGAATDEGTQLVQDAIIGGQLGGPPQVGALSWTSTDGTANIVCSGTLVAPDVVLSARHCAYDSDGQPLSLAGNWVFTLSASNDRSTWTDAKKVVSFAVPPLVDVPATVDWVAPFGAPDLALYKLETPITTVAPLAVSLEPVGFAKPRFTIAGYGLASHTGTPSAGRTMGNTTLLALQGQPAHLVYPTLAAFTLAVSDALQFPVDQFDAVDRAKIQHWYDLTLAQGYEARFGADPMDAAPCHGDSGSPILQPSADGAYQVYGVEQSTIDPNPDNDTQLCDFGPFIALFTNPTAKAFLLQQGLGVSAVATGGASGTSGGSGAEGVSGAGGASAAGAGTSAAGVNSAGASNTLSTTSAGDPKGCSVGTPAPRPLRGAALLSAATLFGIAWRSPRTRARQRRERLRHGSGTEAE
jgi:hypothetical protein